MTEHDPRHDDVPVPGAPAQTPPPVAEPTGPLPPKPDQRPAAPVSPTGRPHDGDPDDRQQAGAYLTTAQGARLRDTDHSLKAGERGPTLLQDHHLREKITHFDHERIPERVVHARGAAAHGTFTGYGTAAGVCRAAFLAEGKQTPVFTRFSTVVGSRGSPDLARDTRGFATKFYTDEGVFDLVGNNFPVFFIQDAIKFPDIVHAAKPHPDREIPQAQSAHDTFWDFVSLHTEAQHHTIWQMSDRAIPRSFRMMEGFGVHTFRLVNEAGETSLVKFHWKPHLGVHSVLWDEAQLTNGADPDFHRRDLADAIEAGAYPEWELGIQVMPDTEDETFEGIDLLDPTKIVPEELAPVQAIGRLRLEANPTNYFAETEQVAFHPGHLVPGIDVTDDPLLQGRLFSYLDTQLTRLGGPNFAQIPINRTHAPVNDMFRDGMHQTADHAGVAPYRPNSLDGGCPFHAGTEDAALIEVPQPVAGPKSRTAAASFDDHFSQVRMFWRSLTPTEQDHVASAYTFELGKCYEEAVRVRQVECLARVSHELATRVATALGLPVPPEQDLADVAPSAALSQIGHEWPIAGRNVAIVVDGGSDVSEIEGLRRRVSEAGMVPLVVAPVAGRLGGDGSGVPVQRTLHTARSVEFDAILLAGTPDGSSDPTAGADARAMDPMGASDAATVDPRLQLLVGEAFRHGKALGAWGRGVRTLEITGCAGAPGVVVGEQPEQVLGAVEELLSAHRVWERIGSAP